ncbi:MraY family glycosyltransferase [Paludibaculum fermentans]|uniref:Undecaprenyl/decaprenyl-phosphate alpha-N-acetylglucosaminyl 1-phosphate transferase n=1 Tax=Paludibaculum fermentans TaxID=1473598 RepID=A0A7S7NMA9_PALFE|nr:MraY family glycosyltransferase [Paludibaculum fermentans]QOY86252.1 undecaprenyl/decaprenyl-phosphate alpha-N-acetylglucosaminyl 1-phosphate transferase [Paludibaculum fermentans]
MRNLFRRWGMTDAADGVRKTHAGAIPRVGGIAIAVSCTMAYGVLLAMGTQGGRIVAGDLGLVWRLAPAVGMVFLVGLLDDLKTLRPWTKFGVQCLAAVTAVLCGVCVGSVGGHPLASWVAVPVTVFWLLLCTNAFNLIDGVDGLATGVGLFATLTVLVAGLIGENYPLVLATVPLAAALLGFLRYNFNPASIFLGDSGSYTIGFLLGCYGVLWSHKSATLLGMTAPLMAFAVPLMDTAVAVIRRFLRSKPVFGADRGHIHHKLLDMGMTPRRAVLVLYGVSGVVAVLSLLLGAGQGASSGLVLVIFGVGAWAGVQSLGYVEIGMASRMVFHGAFRRTLQTQLALQQMDEAMSAAGGMTGRLVALEAAYRELGFCKVRVEQRGRLWESRCPTECGGVGSCPGVWTMQVPLEGNGLVELRHRFTEESVPGGALVPLATILHTRMAMGGSLVEIAGQIKPEPARAAAAAAGGK